MWKAVLLAGFIFSLLLHQIANATTLTWTNSGGDGLASNPANWSGSIVPQTADSIVFDSTSSDNCIWDLNIALASFALNTGYAGAVTLNADFTVTGDMSILDGTLDMNGYDIEVGAASSSSPPTAATDPAENINGNAASLNATVNPNGAETTFYFEWGTDTSYGNITSVQSIGSSTGDIPVTANIYGLSVNTVYHYRVVAANINGTVYGNDIAFTTLSGTVISSATISSNTTWTYAGSPYIINGNISVYGSSEPVLTIEPGVEIRINGLYIINIGSSYYKGILNAQGSISQPIIFTSNSSIPSPGNWYGLTFTNHGSTESVLDYVHVKYAGYTTAGIYINNSSPSISNSVIDSNSNRGVYVSYGSSPIITNSVISNNATYGVYANNTATPTISDTSFTNNGAYAVSAGAGTFGSGITAIGNGTDAIEIQTVIISSNSSWDSQSVPYIIKGDVSVYGTSAPTLTIGAGVTVKFNGAYKLKIGDTSSKGRLEALGTLSNPVLFTSNKTTPAPGDWNGIWFYNHASAESTLDYVTVEYAGLMYGGMYIINSSPSISNSVIRNNSNRGMYITGSSSPVINNATISGNATYGIFAANESTPYITGNSFINNGSYAVRTSASSAGNLGSGNTATGNGTDGIEVQGATVSSDTVWPNASIPYILTGDIYVYGEPAPTLTVEPGVEVRVNGNYRIYIGRYGSDKGRLDAQGTSAQPIMFTSNSPSPAPGNWYGLLFYNHASAESILDHVTVEYAGYGTNGSGIYIYNSSPAITRSTIRNNGDYGFYINGYSSLLIEFSSITDNESYAIYSNSGAINVNHCNITGNGNGIYSSPGSIADARFNWWGDAGGPSGQGSGAGQSVSSGVNFEPWLGAPYTYPFYNTNLNASVEEFSPLNTSVDYSFSISDNSGWTLIIKDSMDTAVRTYSGSGNSASVTWDGRDEGSAIVPDGVYAYELSSTRINDGSLSASLKGNITVGQALPKAEITFPLDRQFAETGTIDIQGTASDSDFTDYTLEYGAGTSPETWSVIVHNQTTPVTDGILGTLDTSALSGNYYTIRLSVNDSAGNKAEDSVEIKLHQAKITSPSDSQDVYGNMNITGTAKSADFKDYTIEFGTGTAPSAWTPVVENNTTPVNSGILAAINFTDLPVGPLTLRLTVNEYSGSSITDSVTVNNLYQIYNLNYNSLSTYFYIIANITHTSDWTVDIKDQADTVIKTFSGTGTSINISWDGKDSSGNRLIPANYSFTINTTEPVSGSTDSAAGNITIAYRPDVSLLPPDNTDGFPVTLDAIVNPNGLETTVYFYWGVNSVTENSTPVQNIGNGINNVPISALLGLKANTRYYYNIRAENSFGVTISNTRSFVTGDDLDSDGVTADIDNCPTVANTNQDDSNSDGVGDSCTVLHCVSDSAGLQQALTNAESNGLYDVIQLEQGTYSISANNNSSFIYDTSGGSGLEAYGFSLEGGYAAGCSSRTMDAQNTVLDGEDYQLTSSSHGMFEIISSSYFHLAASSISIEKITAKRGKGGIDSGGIYITTDAADINITDSIISENTAPYNCTDPSYNTCNLGGGLHIESKTGNLNLTGNQITDNSTSLYSGYITNGGGVYAKMNEGDITLTENTISLNTALGGKGGGAVLEGSQETILERNVIESNNAKSSGGGLYINQWVGTLTLSNNVIKGNGVDGAPIIYGGIQGGGGVWIFGDDDADVIIVNNIVTGNSVNPSYSYYGGGLSVRTEKHVILTNNTITNNFGKYGDGLYLHLYNGYSRIADIYNNIIWGNSIASDPDGDIYLDGAGTYNFFNNDYDPAKVSGWAITNQGNNINTDPLFVNESGGDYHLTSVSPLRNTGSNTAPYLQSADFEGDSRIAEGTSDIGADEYIITSDINVLPLYLDFGNISAGDVLVKTIDVINNGSLNLNISAISSPSEPFSIAADSCSNQILPASASCSIAIEFAPSGEGSISDTLTILSDDTGNPNVIVYISGSAATTVKGTVTDSETGQPLPDVTVKVTDSLNNNSQYVTGSDGKYIISGFAEGDFTVLFTKALYDDYTYDSSISSGQILTLDVQMDIKQSSIAPLTISITSPSDGDVFNATPVTVTGYMINMPGDGGYGETWAQSFKPLATGALNSISLMLLKVGNPADNLYVSLISEAGGMPIATSSPVSAASVTSGSVNWYSFTFTSPPDVTAGNTYFIELWRESRDAANYIEWRKADGYPATDYYTDGKAYHREDNMWSGSQYSDFTFRTYINSNIDAAQETWTTGLHPELYGFNPYPVNVTVRGITATVTNNTFSASVPLYEGSNNITANATSQDSQNASDSINVTLLTKGNIAGTVFGSYTGLPVQSAIVSLTDALGYYRTAYTDTNGNYTLSSVSQGVFIGTVTKAGYATYNISDTVIPGQTITVDAQLNPIFPVISNINVTNITTNSATITWTTDQASDSHVDYGTTTAYGSSTSDSSMVTNHSKTLTGLNPGTTYHFRVTSTNSYGFSSASGDNTFTTTSQIAITITSPLDNDTINRSDIMVRGTVNNSTGNETGVTVNGIVGVVYNGQFFVNHFPLQDGQNTITASATDTAGNTASHSILVNADTTQPYITLRANIESGIAPLTTYFSVSTSIPNSISSYSFDYEGDAVNDYTGTTFEDISVTYTGEGIAYPTITVTDDQSNTYTDTIAIVILNQNDLDALLQAKWAAMKTALGNQDVNGALVYFTENSREMYQYNFQLMQSMLPTIVQDMGSITMKQLENGYAEYEMITTSGGSTRSNYIQFTVDLDGIWKISFF